MAFLFKDYINLIVKAYDEKKDANLLSQLLTYPTTANIRQECLNVYNEKIRKGEPIEENTLRAFFGVPPAGKNFGYVIERYNADRFRPLKSLIKREIKNPALVNVELLAWLINFTPRPLSNAQKVLGNSNTNNSGKAIIDGEEPKLEQTEIILGDENEMSLGKDILGPTKSLQDKESEAETIGNASSEELSSTKFKSNSYSRRLKTITIIGLFIMILSGAIYIIWQEKKTGEAVRLYSLIRNSDAIGLNNNNNTDNASSAVRRQPFFCQAITQKGTRCKRKAKTNGYCWQHSRIMGIKI